MTLSMSFCPCLDCPVAVEEWRRHHAQELRRPDSGGDCVASDPRVTAQVHRATGQLSPGAAAGRMAGQHTACQEDTGALYAAMHSIQITTSRVATNLEIREFLEKSGE